MKTNKPTHTPGPWNADSKSAMTGNMIIKDRFGRIIAQTGLDSEANARLIAAAPDLLLTAQRALESIDEYLIDGQSLGNTGAKLRAAILRATEGR